METPPYYNDLVRTEVENPRKSAYKDAKFRTSNIRSQAEEKADKRRVAGQLWHWYYWYLLSN